MIPYVYKRPALFFVGINPHFGSFRRSVPLSNNKMFWYLLSEAGLVAETREELRDDKHRPTRDVTELKKGEELPGLAAISRIIAAQTPRAECFIGKITYEKYIGSRDFSFGWQSPIKGSSTFVMHFPLRGKAIVRVKELELLKAAASLPDQ